VRLTGAILWATRFGPLPLLFNALADGRVYPDFQRGHDITRDFKRKLG